MPQPRLLHPVPIVLRLIDRGATIYDPDAKEPVQQAARDREITIVAQLSFIHDSAAGGRGLVRLKQGPSETDVGYALLRYLDLKRYGVIQEDGTADIRFNDQITKIGKRAVNYYVTRAVDGGHYSSAGGPTLVRAHFTDRQPQKQG